MKANPMNTAVKALKKQRDNYAAERDKAAEYEEQAKKNKAFFEGEITKLDAHIKDLEKTTA